MNENYQGPEQGGEQISRRSFIRRSAELAAGAAGAAVAGKVGFEGGKQAGALETSREMFNHGLLPLNAEGGMLGLTYHETPFAGFNEIYPDLTDPRLTFLDNKVKLAGNNEPIFDGSKFRPGEHWLVREEGVNASVDSTLIQLELSKATVSPGKESMANMLPLEIRPENTRILFLRPLSKDSRPQFMALDRADSVVYTQDGGALVINLPDRRDPAVLATVTKVDVTEGKSGTITLPSRYRMEATSPDFRNRFYDFLSSRLGPEQQELLGRIEHAEVTIYDRNVGVSPDGSKLIMTVDIRPRESGFPSSLASMKAILIINNPVNAHGAYYDDLSHLNPKIIDVGEFVGQEAAAATDLRLIGMRGDDAIVHTRQFNTSDGSHGVAAVSVQSDKPEVGSLVSVDGEPSFSSNGTVYTHVNGTERSFQFD